MHVAFICTANMCRSVMAHAILESIVTNDGLDITVSSGGTLDLGPSAPANDAWLTCQQHNTPVTKMEATHVSRLPLDAIDLFLVMEHKHRASLIDKHGIENQRIQLLGSYDNQSDEPSIADPIGQPKARFEACHTRLTLCVRRLVESVGDI